MIEPQPMASFMDKRAALPRFAHTPRQRLEEEHAAVFVWVAAIVDGECRVPVQSFCVESGVVSE